MPETLPLGRSRASLVSASVGLRKGAPRLGRPAHASCLPLEHPTLSAGLGLSAVLPARDHERSMMWYRIDLCDSPRARTCHLVRSRYAPSDGLTMVGALQSGMIPGSSRRFVRELILRIKESCCLMWLTDLRNLPILASQRQATCCEAGGDRQEPKKTRVLLSAGHSMSRR